MGLLQEGEGRQPDHITQGVIADENSLATQGKVSRADADKVIVFVPKFVRMVGEKIVYTTARQVQRGREIFLSEVAHLKKKKSLSGQDGASNKG